MGSCAKTHILHPRSPHFVNVMSLNSKLGDVHCQLVHRWAISRIPRPSKYLASHRKPSLSSATAPSSSPCLTFLYSLITCLSFPRYTMFLMLCYFRHAVSPTAILSTHSSFPKSSSKWLHSSLQMLSSDGDFLLWKASSEIPLTQRSFWNWRAGKEWRARG